MLVERQIPMFGLAHNRNISTDGRFWVNQISSIQRSSARFALITIGIFVATMWTFSCNITVGKELLSSFIVILFIGFLNETSFTFNGFENIGSQFAMCFRCGA